MTGHLTIKIISQRQIFLQGVVSFVIALAKPRVWPDFDFLCLCFVLINILVQVSLRLADQEKPSRLFNFWFGVLSPRERSISIVDCVF